LPMLDVPDLTPTVAAPFGIGVSGRPYTKERAKCDDCGRIKTIKHFKWAPPNDRGKPVRCGGCFRGKPFTAYQKRNFKLEELSFSNYREYLRSELWDVIRRQVLARDENRCRACGDRAKNVHHTRYDLDVLIGKDLDSLVSLCRSCHLTAEFNASGDKRDFREVAMVTQGLLLGPWRLADQSQRREERRMRRALLVA
jgi:ferredoxin